MRAPCSWPRMCPPVPPPCRTYRRRPPLIHPCRCWSWRLTCQPAQACQRAPTAAAPSLTCSCEQRRFAGHGLCCILCRCRFSRGLWGGAGGSNRLGCEQRRASFHRPAAGRAARPAGRQQRPLAGSRQRAAMPRAAPVALHSGSLIKTACPHLCRGISSGWGLALAPRPPEFTTLRVLHA